MRETTLGQTPRPVGDIALEKLSDRRPRRFEEHAPGCSERIRHACTRLGGVKRPRGVCVDVSPIESSPDVRASCPPRHPADSIELFVEVGERRCRRRSEKVGHVPWVVKQRKEEPEVVFAVKYLHHVAPLSEPEE